jgi:hypothetical protein
MTVQRGDATIVGPLGPLRKLEDFFDVISPQEEESIKLYQVSCFLKKDS